MRSDFFLKFLSNSVSKLMVYFVLFCFFGVAAWRIMM